MRKFFEDEDDERKNSAFDDPEWSGDISEPPAPKARKESNIEFLKGSSVPVRVKLLELEIIDVRKPLGFDTEFTVDFELTDETREELEEADEDCDALDPKCHSWNINKTNRRLFELFLKSNFKRELPGCVIQVEVVPGATPDGEPCRTLRLAGLKQRSASKFVSVERQRRKRNLSNAREY